MVLRAAAVALLLFASTVSSAQPLSVRSVDNDKSGNRHSVLVLSDGRRFETTLYEAAVLAALPTL